MGHLDDQSGRHRHRGDGRDARAAGDRRLRFSREPDPPRDYLGINHLGWLRALRAGGTDLLPDLLNDPERVHRTEEGRLFGADLLRSLGAIPNEYLYWYYANREALRDLLAAGRTRGEHVP